MSDACGRDREPTTPTAEGGEEHEAERFWQVRGRQAAAVPATGSPVPQPGAGAPACGPRPGDARRGHVVHAGRGPSRLRPLRRRGALFGAAAAVASIDLGAKVWAQRVLPADGIEAGPVDLRLAYNPGVAFSLAADAPAFAVLAVTGVITAVIAVLAWRTATTSTTWRAAGLAAILGGAVANLADRAGDGVVTDYLHSGWWPTFNLADTAIVTGAALLVLASVRSQHDGAQDRRSRSGTNPPCHLEKSATMAVAGDEDSAAAPTRS